MTRLFLTTAATLLLFPTAALADDRSAVVSNWSVRPRRP